MDEDKSVKSKEQLAKAGKRFFDKEKWGKRFEHLKILLVLLIVYIFFNPIVVIGPGQVGVVYSAWGGVDLNRVLAPGWHLVIPVLQRIYYVQTARDTINLMPEGDDIPVSVPTREGLVVTSDVSAFFRARSELAPKIIQELTPYYRGGTLVPRIRSAVREVTGGMSFTELYGPGREKLQEQVYDKLRLEFEKDGFVLESVLVRNMQLPDTLVRAIEEKQATEQAVLKKQFEVDLAKKEAERKKIEADGIAAYKEGVAQGEAKALKIVAEALKVNPEVLKSKQLDILSQLYANPSVRWVLPSNQVILPLDLNISR